jgi:hypothetical protein
MDAVDVRGLLGLLLADGCFAHYRGPAGGYIQLTLTAGANESAFLGEKAEEFRRFLPTKARITPYKTKPRPSGLCSEVLRFRVSSNRLRPIYNMLYPDGERTITQSVLDLLGARAAAWLWAEGARPARDGSAQLARIGSTTEEAAIVSRWLSMLTGAEGYLVDAMVRPRLGFTPDQAGTIRRALQSYAPLTRIHLFQEQTIDRVGLRSARTELLARRRQVESEEDGTGLD